jgi:peptidoglycan/xylan/chitin deacetylase (PgdA/CDA1 family)
MLRTHGRYEFCPIVGRPDFVWPGGKRLAVFIALNVEVFPFDEGLDILNYSWKDYGNRVGVWNLIDLFDVYKLPVSVLLNTEIYEQCPQVAEAFRKRGDEFVGHGRTNAEKQGKFDELTERTLLQDCRNTIQQHEGKPPLGWLSPGISETQVTPDLVEEAGYEYLLDWAFDDQPVWMRTRSGGRILSLPYSRPNGDMPQFMSAKLTPKVFADTLIDQIEEMLLQSKNRSLVFNLSLHPFLIGQAFRLRHLRRVFDCLDKHSSEIWVATAGQISQFAGSLPQGTIV